MDPVNSSRSTPVPSPAGLSPVASRFEPMEGRLVRNYPSGESVPTDMPQFQFYMGDEAYTVRATQNAAATLKELGSRPEAPGQRLSVPARLSAYVETGVFPPSVREDSIALNEGCEVGDGFEVGPPTSTAGRFNIEKARAGEDFPTDSPPKNFNVWVAARHVRIPIGDISAVDRSRAGIDFPTDSPDPRFSVFVTPQGRFPAPSLLKVEKAKAGVDYPTDSPPPSPDEVLTWKDANGDQRVLLSSIASIEKAKAGIDFPTDGPPDLERNFLVLTTHGGDRIQISGAPV
jgi:hypothetical protein